MSRENVVLSVGASPWRLRDLPRTPVGLAALLMVAGCSTGGSQGTSPTAAPAPGAARPASVAEAPRLLTSPRARGAKGRASIGTLPPHAERAPARLPSWMTRGAASPRSPVIEPSFAELMPSDAGAYGPPFPDRVPQMRSFGGPVLASPKIVAVLYSADKLETELIDFTNKLGASSYWAATTAEYGVGPAVALPPVIKTAAPPAEISVNKIVADLTAALSSGDPAYPVPTNDTIYELFFPGGTKVTWGASVGCTDWGGFHSTLSLPGGITPAYSMLPRCNDYLGFPAAEDATLAASHEAIEAATDPPSSPAAFSDLNFPATSWSYVIGLSDASEVGDMCELSPNLGVVPADLGYTVQRTWSNAAAAGGHDPCVPAPAGTYFAALPMTGGTEANAYNGEEYVQGITLTPGDSTTLEVRLFSDGPTSDWALSAEEIASPHFDPDPGKLLSFSFDKDHGNNGDVRHLTVTYAPVPDGGIYYGFATFAIVSTLGPQVNMWPVVVGN